MSWVSIDQETCTGCGMCVAICGRGCFRQGSDVVEARADETNCSRCGHCIAICPEAAVVHHRMDMAQFDDVSRAEDIIREQLLRVIRKRRSHRHFKDKMVSRADLEALVDVCRYAPTGSNAQTVEILVITDQEKIKRLSARCIEHFIQTVAQTEKKSANPSSPGKELPEAVAFDQKWTAMMQRHINAWNDNRDTVLRNAPAVMVFHSTPYTSTPKDDCVIAAHTVVLYAMTLGLETCYIGLLEISAAASPAIMEELGLPDGNEVYSVLILGYPKYRFLRAVGRKPIKASWV